ncbi:MAG: fused MFS/spermidine synthase [Acidobacteria bacterium]|nr:fused MFS/spermidine synthase [Acidobacteriota bacterium]
MPTAAPPPRSNASRRRVGLAPDSSPDGSDRYPTDPPGVRVVPRRRLLASLVFLSGAASLVYEVLWLKELGLLFGSTAYAASTTLAVFFLGLAVGGAVFGRWSPHLRSPLRAYAWLELGVAASAALYFVLIEVYFQFYGPVYDALADRPAAFNAFRIALATLVLLPPAALMGGTLPVLGQHLVRRPDELGRHGTRLYAVNTIGAASGAFLAGFVLPPLLGFDRAYLLAMAVNVVVAAVAWWWSRIDEGGAAIDAVDAAIGGGDATIDAGRAPRIDTGGAAPGPDVAADRPRPAERRGRVARGRRRATTAPGAAAAAASAWAASPTWLAAVAVLSGGFALGLEVLWTRMFAQVLQNSVYTFSTILVVFLAALAAGSAIANRLCRVQAAPAHVLWALLALSGLAVAATPFAFHRLTAGLSTLTTGDAWIAYVASIFANALLLLFVPATLLGSVFPYLLRASEGSPAAPGAIIGRLGALNTAGGVVGALAAGFVLLGTIGLWNGIRLMAAGYLLLALAIAWSAWGDSRRERDGRADPEPRRPTGRARLLPAAATVGSLALLATALDASRLPLVGVATERGEALIATWEGPDGVVAVTERAGNRRLKMNNFYTLGGTGSMEQEQNQALLPLMTHPHPRAVFLLGLGTGITAGTALRHAVERLVVCEIAPDVIAAAAAYFDQPSGGLFSDPRASVRACDARNHLLGTAERYDVILADLFIPWRAGVGNLYSREHFEAARERLTAGGIFVQWFPLFQVSRREFDLVARTMLDVFEQVTLWRGSFSAELPFAAFVGATEPTTLDPEVIARNGLHLSGGAPLPDATALAVTLPFYAGNLSAAEGLIPPGPINTDDRPLVEYLAPVTQREERAGATAWFHSAELAAFFRRLAELAPPARDPHLALLTDAQRDFVTAGLSYYRGAVARRLGRDAEAERHFRDFAGRIPIAFRPPLDEPNAEGDVVP